MPVFGDATPDYRSLRIGDRIRMHRKQRGLTLRDVSDRLSISVATLSAIETDRAVLDLERLVAISEVLGVRPDALFPRSRSCHFHIVRRSNLDQIPAASVRVSGRAPGDSRPYHNILRPLAAPFVGKHIEPCYMQLPPPTDEDPEFITHDHEEFFFVLRGCVECLLKTPDGLVRERLSPGDCMYFWSHLPHSIRGAGPEGAESIHVLYSGYGATDAVSADMAIVRGSQRRTLTDQIASKVAAFPRSEGISPADFARLLNMSVRRLNEIERGRKPVSIELLLRICRVFRKPLEYFLAGTMVEKPFYFVQRAAAINSLGVRPRRRLVDGSWSSTEFRALASGFGPRGMYPYHVKLRHPTSEPSLHEHHGQEFVYVVNGEVSLVTIIDGERVTHRLSSGDMCFIDSTVPHRFVGQGVSPYDESSTEVIDVFWCPLGESYLFADDAARIEEAAPSTIDSRRVAEDAALNS